MSDVKVRTLEDWVVATHRARARLAGRSLEEQLRLELTEAALRSQRDFAGRTAALRAAIRSEQGELSDSTPLIRADRDQRG
jgi:plasmid stability protein